MENNNENMLRIYQGEITLNTIYSSDYDDAAVINMLLDEILSNDEIFEIATEKIEANGYIRIWHNGLTIPTLARLISFIKSEDILKYPVDRCNEKTLEKLEKLKKCIPTYEIFLKRNENVKIDGISVLDIINTLAKDDISNILTPTESIKMINILKDEPFNFDIPFSFELADQYIYKQSLEINVLNNYIIPEALKVKIKNNYKKLLKYVSYQQPVDSEMVFGEFLKLISKEDDLSHLLDTNDLLLDKGEIIIVNLEKIDLNKMEENEFITKEEHDRLNKFLISSNKIFSDKKIRVYLKQLGYEKLIIYIDEFINTIKNKEDIEKLLKQDTIYGYSKDEFLKMLNLLTEYHCGIYNKLIIEFRKDLRKYLRYNFETQKDKYSNIHLNDKLKKTLLKEMPPQFNKLQQIYYIYRRLCQKLTYDQEVYIVDQKRMVTINHEDVDRISKINFDENEIVCYEFSLILGKFAELLGMPYNLLGYDEDDYEYGVGHAYVKFRAGEYVIEADAAHGIIDSDISFAKTDLGINNFSVINEECCDMVKYKKDLNLVDEYIKDNIKDIDFEDSAMLFSNINNEIDQLTFEERKRVFLDILKEKKGNILDYFRFFKEMSEKIFTDKYKDCYQLTMISSNVATREDREFELVLVIWFKEKFKNEYYIYRNGDIELLNKRKMKKLFRNHEISYIDGGHMIRGINNQSRK